MADQVDIFVTPVVALDIILGCTVDHLARIMPDVIAFALRPVSRGLSDTLTAWPPI
jgi:hypothetical protein